MAPHDPGEIRDKEEAEIAQRLLASAATKEAIDNAIQDYRGRTRGNAGGSGSKSPVDVLRSPADESPDALAALQSGQ